MKYWPMILIMLIILACTTHGQRNTADDLTAKWQVVSFTTAGESGSEDEAKKYKVVFDNGTFIVSKDGSVIQEGTYELIPGEDPKAADLNFANGDKLKAKTALGIYRITDDELSICFTAPSERVPPGGERPQVFESTAENGYRLNVYKRISE